MRGYRHEPRATETVMHGRRRKFSRGGGAKPAAPTKNLWMFTTSAEGSSKTPRVFCGRSSYDVIIFKFQGGGLWAPLLWWLGAWLRLPKTCKVRSLRVVCTLPSISSFNLSSVTFEYGIFFANVRKYCMTFAFCQFHYLSSISWWSWNGYKFAISKTLKPGTGNSIAAEFRS